MAQPPTLKSFLNSFRDQWFTLMSGGLTVPLTALSILAPQTPLKGLFALLAIACGLYSSYRVWSHERRTRNVAEKRVQELEFAPDRPKLSFRSWGQVRLESLEFLPTEAKVSLRFQRGFYLANDGGVALDIEVEAFSIGSQFTAYGSPIARIESGGEGFSEIRIKDADPMARHALDLVLGIARDEKINKGELEYVKPFVIPVSVIYRDFNDLWYRTSCELISHYRRGTTAGWIEFTAPTQKSLGARARRDGQDDVISPARERLSLK